VKEVHLGSSGRWLRRRKGTKPGSRCAAVRLPVARHSVCWLVPGRGIKLRVLLRRFGAHAWHGTGCGLVLGVLAHCAPTGRHLRSTVTIMVLMLFVVLLAHLAQLPSATARLFTVVNTCPFTIWHVSGAFPSTGVVLTRGLLLAGPPYVFRCPVLVCARQFLNYH
jgi:hypothetical protein